MLSPEGKILRHEDAGVFRSGTFIFLSGGGSQWRLQEKTGVLYDAMQRTGQVHQNPLNLAFYSLH